MNDHTPGPWRVLAHQNGPSIEAVKTQEGILHMLPRLTSKVEADARLISAAPDLLAALREVQPALQCRGSWKNDCGCRQCRAWQVAEDALNKASGKVTVR